MKLKSIFMMAMAAIMVFAGGAFAATTITTNTATLDTPEYAHGCGTNCASPLAAAFAADTIAGVGTSGTGFGTVAMPSQVAFDTVNGVYIADPATGLLGVGPTSGYNMVSTAAGNALFGMCGNNPSANGLIVGAVTCPKWVPTPAAVLVDAREATGGIEGGAFNTEPLGTADFNQGTFVTGLVSGFAQAAGRVADVTLTVENAMTNRLSLRTIHHALTAIPGSDGDYIDQRLSQNTSTEATPGVGGVDNVGVGNVVLGQQVIAGAGSDWAGFVPDGATAVGYLGNADPANNLPADCALAGGALYLGTCYTADSGVVRQSVGDSASGAFGSYGQDFRNANTPGTGVAVPTPTGAITVYNAPLLIGAAPVGTGAGLP
ncbi:MAG: hypothetical protein HYR79_03250 [Nitrospirae bacterium]|nr:hypothetical protein [Nitrospirota bacterium]